MHAVLAEFDALLQRERTTTASLADGARRPLTQRLDALDGALKAMVGSAADVFGSLRKGDRDAAGRHRVTMDDLYGAVANTIVLLNDELLRLQSHEMDEQERLATNCRGAERVLAIAVLMMVAAAARYSQHVSRRMRQVDRERDDHLAALEATRSALQEHLENLDRKVQERTAELASTNRELSRVADIVDSTDDAIFSTDRELRVLTWNPAAAAIFGHAPAEIIGRSVNVLIPEELRAEAAAMRRRVWEERTPTHYETIRCRKEGTRFPASLTVSPILGNDGSVEALGGILRDITDSVGQRERLIESERRLAEAQEIASVGSWELDLESKEVTWSAQQFRLLGFPADSDQPPSYEAAMRAIHPEDRPGIEAAEKPRSRRASRFAATTASSGRTAASGSCTAARGSSRIRQASRFAWPARRRT